MALSHAIWRRIEKGDIVKGRSFRPVILTLAFCLVLAASPALVEAAPSALAEVDVPGTELIDLGSPVSGSLAPTHRDDVYRVYLAAGDTFNCSLTPLIAPSIYPCDIFLFGPGTTTVSDKRLQLLSSAQMHYTATTAGYHYLDLYLPAGSASYTFSWNITKAGTTATLPKAVLTAPSHPSSARRYRTFISSGYLKPRHTAGAYSVQIRCYHKEGTIWRLRKTVRAKNYNYSTYTKYQASVSLPYTGYWKLKAVAPADSRHSTSYSPYSTTFRVYY